MERRRNERRVRINGKTRLRDQKNNGRSIWGRRYEGYSMNYMID